MLFTVLPSAPKSVGEELLGFCLHTVLAMIGGFLFVVMIVPALLHAVCLVASINLHDVPGIFQRPFGPIFALADVLLGFLSNRHLRHRSAPYIGVLGLVWLTTAVVWDFMAFGHSTIVAGHFWRYEFRQLFSPNCSDCLEQLFITAPAMALIFYSVGAAIGLRDQSRKPVQVC